LAQALSPEDSTYFSEPEYGQLWGQGQDSLHAEGRSDLMCKKNSWFYQAASVAMVI